MSDTSSSKLRIAFIGLGAMGDGMVRNLLQSGFSVKVYNRTQEKAWALVETGAVLSHSAREAATDVDVVITMLSNDAVLEAVVQGENGILAGVSPGTIHLSMSTVSPETSRKLAPLHAQRQAQLVAAPVFGRPEMAASKKLWICTSGPATAIARTKPVLEALSQGVFEFGEDVGAANIVKLSGNFMIASCVEVMAEVATLAEKNSVDPNAVLGMLTSTIFACPMYQRYSDLLLKQDFSPGFKLELGFKDMNLIQAVALKSQTPMPFLGVVQQRYLKAMAEGRASQDWSGIALNARQDAGLPLQRGQTVPDPTTHPTPC